MTEEINESPKEQPSGNWLSWWPSCGCLTYGAVGFAVFVFFFVPSWINFRESYPRAMETRAKTDIRYLGQALEAYAVDHRAYPPHAAGARGVNASAKPNDPAGAITTFAVDAGAETFLVPLASQSGTRPFDIYSASRKTYYGYYTTGNSWVLFSAGPDLVYDVLDPSRLPATPDGDLDPKQFQDLTFDATNGTTSRGDIFQFGGKATHAATQTPDPEFVKRSERLFRETPAVSPRPDVKQMEP